jgi:NAD(P)H-nitrite reductase large subunit
MALNKVDDKRTVVVCGLGMVALSFIEKLLKYDTKHQFRVEVFCEEAYGRIF